MLEVTNVSKSFGQVAVLQEVSFQLARGETLALVGTSGSGKTTLLKLLNRLLERDGGEILWEGRSIDQESETALRRQIGYVIQQGGLFPHRTVAENIATVPRLLGWDPARRTERTATLMAQLQLPKALATRYPAALSGGQQQRVGVARALAAHPPLILLDEPFGALDPITRRAIRREFRELPELRDKTMVLVTHDLLEAFELADRVCLLDQGRVQQCATPATLLLEPQNDFVRAFLAEQWRELAMLALRLRHVFPHLNLAPDNAGMLISDEAPLRTLLDQGGPPGDVRWSLEPGQGPQGSFRSVDVWQALQALWHASRLRTPSR